MAVWEPMLAKYDGKCSGCIAPVLRGDSIRYYRKEKEVMHNKCWKRRFKR